MNNPTEKLAAYFLAAPIALGIYFNADNEKRLEEGADYHYKISKIRGENDNPSIFQLS